MPLAGGIETRVSILVGMVAMTVMSITAPPTGQIVRGCGRPLQSKCGRQLPDVGLARPPRGERSH